MAIKLPDKGKKDMNVGQSMSQCCRKIEFKGSENLQGKILLLQRQSKMSALNYIRQNVLQKTKKSDKEDFKKALSCKAYGPSMF